MSFTIYKNVQRHTEYSSETHFFGFYKKWPGLFFLYFHLFNTVDNKQMFYKSLPMTGFELWISGVEGDRSTN